MRRIAVFASLLLVVVAACRPGPLQRDRFMVVREVDRPGNLLVIFGRCKGEAVVRVELRYADPPDEAPYGGVLWRIASPASSRSRFFVGETPPGFREAIALGPERLPSQYLVVSVLTDDERWPETTRSFRLDQLHRRATRGYSGPTTARQIDEATRSGCKPYRPAYA
jgi:hypothetical protein